MTENIRLFFIKFIGCDVKLIIEQYLKNEIQLYYLK